MPNLPQLTSKEWAQNFPAHMQPMAESMFASAMQAQHQATWTMAIEAAAKVCEGAETSDGVYDYPLNYDKDIRALPCPLLETKGE